MNRNPLLRRCSRSWPAATRTLLFLCVALCSLGASAQQVKYWVGGNGDWGSAANWSVRPHGIGGAGVPRASDVVEIDGPATVHITDNAQCDGLVVDGRSGTVEMGGGDAALRLHGDLVTKGAVRWTFGGTLVLDGDAHEVSGLDLRGLPLACDVHLIDGTWSMVSDVVLDDARTFTLVEGDLTTNGNLLRAGTLRMEGHHAKRLYANASVVLLAQAFDAGNGGPSVDPGTSRLVVGGVVRDWGAAATAAQGADRNINICGTGAGQTLFTINATLVSNFNGFGVSCHGTCNGQVQVAVTGGVGPFAYNWIGGPATAVWNNVCAGNQIVIVTDQGQGVSCATTVQVTDPARLSVIFFGNQPPTCSTVCDGTSNALAVGGVPTYTYNWNNGAGSGSSFSQLCPGSNHLHVTDANNCAFDTTFIFNVLPISPNLTVTNTQCSGTCNGSATAAPTGGTGTYTYNWAPAPGGGQGTSHATGLCPGNYTLTIVDVNGCDTAVQFQVTAPPPILPHETHVNATCSDRCDGSATVAPTGAAGPFTYTWAPAPGGGQGTSHATGLCPSSYTCTIHDNTSGCDTTVTIVIGSPTPIIPNPLHTDLTCNGICNGTASVSPSGGTPGNYSYLWTPQPPVGQGTPDILQLCAGVWTVRIVDIAGCDTIVPITIAQPPPIVPNGTFTDPTCNGVCNGTATVAPTGGTGSFTYQWVPAPGAGQGTAHVTGLCAGSYTVTIRDAVGCSITYTVNLVAPPPMVVTPTQTNVTCGSNCDGTASVIVTGGTPGYSYSWSPAPPVGQGTPNASGLCAGTWTLTITDSQGCTKTQVFTILPAVPIQISLNVTPASCADVCDGTAGVIVTGGSGAYTYVWSPAPGAGQGTANATGLCAQAYSLTVTDALGCDTTISFTITAPPAIQPHPTVTNATCHGTCNGSIVLAPTGGNGTYTYVWTPVPPNGQGTAQATSLCVGSYQVVITSGACDTTLTFQVLEPPPISANVTVTPATCAGSCDGAASSAASGGTPGYTYSWSPAPGAGQGTPNASAMCPGTYTLTIVDANGCDTAITVVITAPPPIVPNLTVTPASCGGGCDGTASVAPTGGTGTFTFLWTPAPGAGQGTPNATGLCVGNYSITITDAAGCDTTLQFTITTPPSLVVTPTVTNASCANACDGAISLATSGGVPGYTYAWSPAPGAGQGTNAVSGLCPGDWTVVVSDAAGCDTTLVIHVDAPPAIVPNGTHTDESCNGPCDGTASVAPSGGSGTYNFTWSPNPPSGQGTPNVSGLCPGDWTVVITDAAGCDTSVTFTILPNVPLQATFNTLPTPCSGACGGSSTINVTGGAGGYTYNWSPAPGAGQGTASVTGLCLGIYSVTVTDASGCSSVFTTTVTGPPPIDVQLTTQNESCGGACTGSAEALLTGGGGGFVLDWQPAPVTGQGTTSVTGLCAGINYTLTVTDVNGCDTVITFTILPYTQLLPNTTVTPITCAGACDGVIGFAPTGGQPSYDYFWTPIPPNGQSVQQGTGLCAGTYVISVKDARGCDTLVTVTLTDPQPISTTAVVQNVRCSGQCDGSIALTPSGGSGTYTYNWSPAPPVGQGTPNISALCAGAWTVTITDVNGCDTTITYTITAPLPIVVTADVTQSHCAVCDGTAFLHTSGGTPGYVFDWSSGLNTTDSLVTDLCAGVYTVNIADAAGCSSPFTVVINDANGETITTTDGTTSCPNRCDGAVSVAFNCSAPTCTIAWFDGAGTDLNQNGNSLSGLCPGTYLAQVTNGAGCITIDTATVVAPPAITTGISSTPVSCAALCDGTATVGITGGSGPFTITWSPAPGAGQGTPLATGLCAGPYDIHISDGIGCDTTYSVLILPATPIDVISTVTDISCAGQCDGTIALNATGGSGALTYLWNPLPPVGQGTPNTSALCVGTYTVTVSDANGCDTTLSFTLADPQPIVLAPTITPSHCQACDGSAALAVSGGTGTVTVTWTDASGTVVGSGNALNALCAGVYTATAVDTHGCSATIAVAITDVNGETLTMIDGQTLCANACDGQVGVTFACTVGPCSITWYDASANAIAQNQFTVTGLCPGDYLAEVTNGAGCVSIDTATVTPSTIIIPNLSSTPVTCAGNCDGTATVGPAGGVGPYTYDWSPDPIAGDGTPSVTGLCAGVYTVLIADNSGCDTLVSVLITEPPAIQVNAVVDMVSCSGACDGHIGLTALGGNGGFTYNWSPVPPAGQGVSDATGLCAGTWNIAVTDANGCRDVVSYTITEPDPLDVTFTTTQSTCAVCTGTASAMPSGGTLPYTYTWTQGSAIVSTDSALTGLCAGLYVLTVTDAHGCSAQLQVPVTDANGEAVTTTGDVVTCPGTCDGDVSASFNCTVPTCTVAWFDASGNDLGQSGTSVSNLCAGTYFVQVTNGLGCVTLQPAVVTDPAQIVANLSTTPATCAGSCDGTATVGPTGGAGGYTYDWDPDPPNGDGTPQATGLCAGSYTVTITDATGCSITQSVLILQPLPITATAVVGPITCNGACDGSITVDVQGGSGGYLFNWSPAPGGGQGTNTVTGLCAGDWSLTITDVNGCDTTFVVPVTEPPAMLVILTVVDNVCYGDCTGSAHAEVSGGGGGPYTITWTDAGGNTIGQDVTDVTALCAGDYTVTATDNNGCARSQPFSIGQGTAIDAALVFTNETCNGPCDGTATINPNGGSGSYTVNWQPVPPNGQGTNSVSGLCAGNWSVTITDALGCDTTYAFTITPFTPIVPNAEVSQVSCNGLCNGVITVAPTGGGGTYTYTWSPVPPNGQGNPTANGLCPGDWSVTIADASGCDTTITTTITEPEVLAVDLDEVIDASCNTATDGAISITISGGTPTYTIQWAGPNSFASNNEDISGLAPGIYTVTVTDDHACQDTEVFTVNAANGVTADAGADQVGCSSADIVLDGSNSQGGTSFQWTDDGGNVVGNTLVVDLGPLSVGDHVYTLTVTDGPCSASDQVLITISASPLANAGADQSVAIQGTVQLGGNPSGPSGSTFSWTPDSLLDAANAPNPFADVSHTTWFVLTVTSPNGCVSVDSVLITVVPQVVVPSGFTPNGDGHNDVWQIDYIELFPNCEVEIYNRWGEPLFKSVGYHTPWDGRYNGGFVPVGTYYYAINLNDPRFPEALTGPLTVIR